MTHFFKMKLFANDCHVELLIFVNEIHETQLITEMVSNGLLQVPNKKLQQKICQVCSALYKEIWAGS